MPQLRFPEGDDRQFQCFMKEDDLDCTFADRCGLEVGRHLHRDHGVSTDDITWGKIWNKVGIVSKDYGTVIREQWGRKGEQWGGKVKYAYGKTKTEETSIQVRIVEESIQQWVPAAVKYKRGVFKPAPPTDSDDSWPYKLLGLASVLRVLHTNQNAVRRLEETEQIGLGQEDYS